MRLVGYLRTYVNVAESRGCLRLLALLLAGSIAAGGCLTLDDVPARARWQYGPFAEELFGVWEQELGYSEPAALAPARVARLQRMEGEVLPALARTVEGPVGEEPGLLQLLHSPDALALWDDGTIDGLLGDAALLLERLERDGQPGLAAVAHLLD
ncbi:MAG: hypothetical protein FJ125_16835, partial [Deltaproteobacteria bacterium]|nr:hypothetical protein [Deltaproteobacteria bacterium]